MTVRAGAAAYPAAAGATNTVWEPSSSPSLTIVAANVTDAVPAATTTVGGTVSSVVSVEARLTVRLLAGVGLTVTVPTSGAPPSLADAGKITVTVCVVFPRNSTSSMFHPEYGNAPLPIT